MFVSLRFKNLEDYRGCHFLVEIHKLSFGFHAATISYICSNKLPFFPRWRHPLPSVFLIRKWIRPQCDIELTTSHIAYKQRFMLRQGYCYPILFLWLCLYLPLFPLCLPNPSIFPPLQLTVIESGLIALVRSSRQPILCLTSVFYSTRQCCNYITAQWYQGCLCQGDAMWESTCVFTVTSNRWRCKRGSTADTVTWINHGAFRQNGGPYIQAGLLVSLEGWMEM